ncbi:hypothetical protein CEXT_219661 [Caerostris extrusa]|uniref:Uncharacterized protein n=1 Tax=Caerostris extrusa TaxID=172846 RepID=A0AAV4XIR2_CAEEX|nr:hypothetical protein CEXT_219661 [Caerostris extrusa]
MLLKNPKFIFLKKVRTPPGVGTHKMAPSIILPVVSPLGESMAHTEWGGRRKEISRKTGRFGDGPEIASV